jgi:integrase
MLPHFKPAVINAGLPSDVRFHDLGRTCAALLIANGCHMEKVKEHLGHSSIRVTSDRYGHLFPSARASVADALDATYRGHLADLPRTEGSIVPLPGRSQSQI